MGNILLFPRIQELNQQVALSYFNLAFRLPLSRSDHKTATHLIPYSMSYTRLIGVMVSSDTKCYKLMGRTHP